MKRFTLFLLSFLAASSLIKAQNTVIDTHPNSSIFAIDYQSGKQVQVTSDAAILFKDAFIELVIHTDAARAEGSRSIPGRKTFVITPLSPRNGGRGYQLSLQSRYMNQTITIYSFQYNIDQNTLYFYNQSSQSWVPELVQGHNVVNLNNCLALSKFNEQDQGYSQPAPDQGANNTQPLSDDYADNTPVDTAVTTNTSPPPLPEYQQPECPTEGYLWQPGYWAYSLTTGGYYWVPGVWVAPPRVGFLWTPPYWGFYGGRYVFHTGYWGPHIGFYGGINYGFGYIGVGFVGGEWRGGYYHYNTAVVRVNTTVIHNTYVNTTVINNQTIVNNRASFNGQGGVSARPTSTEIAAAREQHVMATSEQIKNQRLARADKTQFASANGGRPANLAAERVPQSRPNFNSNARANVNNGQIGVRGNGNGAAGLNPGANGSRPASNRAPGANGAAGVNQGAGSANRPSANGPGTYKPSENKPAPKNKPAEKKDRKP